MLSKHSRKGKSRTGVLMAAGSYSRFQWYMNNAGMRSLMGSRSSVLLGNGSCQRASTFQLKLGLFKWSKQVAFDAVLRIPTRRHMNQGFQCGASLNICAFCLSHRSQHRLPCPIFTATTVLLLVPESCEFPASFVLIQRQILVRVLGRPMLRYACWTAHCHGALVNRKLQKAVGHEGARQLSKGWHRSAAT